MGTLRKGILGMDISKFGNLGGMRTWVTEFQGKESSEILKFRASLENDPKTLTLEKIQFIPISLTITLLFL